MGALMSRLWLDIAHYLGLITVPTGYGGSLLSASDSGYMEKENDDECMDESSENQENQEDSSVRRRVTKTPEKGERSPSKMSPTKSNWTDATEHPKPKLDIVPPNKKTKTEAEEKNLSSQKIKKMEFESVPNLHFGDKGEDYCPDSLTPDVYTPPVKNNPEAKDINGHLEEENEQKNFEFSEKSKEMNEERMEGEKCETSEIGEGMEFGVETAQNDVIEGASKGMEIEVEPVQNSPKECSTKEMEFEDGSTQNVSMERSTREEAPNYMAPTGVIQIATAEPLNQASPSNCDITHAAGDSRVPGKLSRADDLYSSKALQNLTDPGNCEVTFHADGDKQVSTKTGRVEVEDTFSGKTPQNSNNPGLGNFDNITDPTGNKEPMEQDSEHPSMDKHPNLVTPDPGYHDSIIALTDVGIEVPKTGEYPITVEDSPEKLVNPMSCDDVLQINKESEVEYSGIPKIVINEHNKIGGSSELLGEENQQLMESEILLPEDDKTQENGVDMTLVSSGPDSSEHASSQASNVTDNNDGNIMSLTQPLAGNHEHIVQSSFSQPTPKLQPLDGSSKHKNSAEYNTENIDPNIQKEKITEAKTKQVSVQWTGQAENVSITGSWINWQGQVELQKSDNNIWLVNLDLEKNLKEIELKFIVDGCWLISPDIPTMQDESGNRNNYIRLVRRAGHLSN